APERVDGSGQRLAEGAAEPGTHGRRRRVRVRLPGWLGDEAIAGQGAQMASDTSQRDRAETSANGRAPEKPTGLRTKSWFGVFKRTIREFKEDNVTDWAAALTYYGVLAIFPAIIALVSILGLIGPSATQPLIQNLGKIAPGPAQHIFTSAITNVQHSRGAAG